ncbi:hypothetical protein VTN96DRAFT_164 [Rasamsonia emersonii]|uniref:Ribonuclease H2 subunit B n=1 Tax=Rasamsonia emersonii (strain ATCC 16479 / CBS 393.64 / IMI 116815) TaxID=1408163 RepID=A0A0F4YTT3_RASE3|nr:hypothetical protein T310_4907 [Rasamsonia emersonii CBS 393.64]KKA21048.1 hypothetical protein T310_4907 [Rasamsonia emersonii CBS 393.64]
MKTRSRAPVESSETEEHGQKALETAHTPSRTFILPSRTSDATRFVSLPNPSTGSLNRYLFCPEAGLYEFTAVAPAPHQPRSILFTPKADEISVENEGQKQPSKGAISKKAELLIATPIDIMFFMLPILAPAASNNSAKKLFQPLDDILDMQEGLSPHLRHVLYNESFRPTLERRMEAICDTVEAGDEKMYRFSEAKLVKELLAKAERMVSQGLPATLEERFVRQELEVPLQSVKREDIVTDENTGSVEESRETESPDQSETQSSAAATAASASTPSGVSTPATQPSMDDALTSGGIKRLLRIRVALSFMQSSYLPAHLSASVDEALSSPESPVDFKPLEERLKHIAELRAEALASRSAADYTRKRAAEDEDARESRAEKKRRKEEEEKKKKAGESRGVRELKKVDTSGMKKMSDFFSKVTPKKES